MAGSFRSRWAIVALASAVAASTIALTAHAVGAVTAGWRRIRTAVSGFGRWLVARFPRMRPDWLSAWRRIRAVRVVMPPVMWAAMRRPRVSPRWRMCPSV